MRGDAIQRGDHILPPQALPDVDGQALARVVIDHGQRPQPAPIEQFIGDKIHTPDFVDRGGHLLWLP